MYLSCRCLIPPFHHRSSTADMCKLWAILVCTIVCFESTPNRPRTGVLSLGAGMALFSKVATLARRFESTLIRVWGEQRPVERRGRVIRDKCSKRPTFVLASRCDSPFWDLFVPYRISCCETEGLLLSNWPIRPIRLSLHLYTIYKTSIHLMSGHENFNHL